MNDKKEGESTYCRKCQQGIPEGSPYCPNCGYRKTKIQFAGDPIESDQGIKRPLPFRWWVILIMIFMVPIAAFGTCLVSNPSIDHPDWRVDAAWFVELASIGIGLIMIVVNGIVALFRAK